MSQNEIHMYENSKLTLTDEKTLEFSTMSFLTYGSAMVSLNELIINSKLSIMCYIEDRNQIIFPCSHLTKNGPRFEISTSLFCVFHLLSVCCSRLHVCLPEGCLVNLSLGLYLFCFVWVCRSVRVSACLSLTKVFSLAFIEQERKHRMGKEGQLLQRNLERSFTRD